MATTQNVRATAEEAQANARSIAAIPNDQCPWPGVMAALIQRALSGHDCYAYRPANQQEYVIWDRQPDPATESRFSPCEWARRNGFAVDGKEAW